MPALHHAIQRRTGDPDTRRKILAAPGTPWPFSHPGPEAGQGDPLIPGSEAFRVGTLAQHLLDLTAQNRRVKFKSVGAGEQALRVAIPQTDSIRVSAQQVLERALATRPGHFRICENRIAEGMFGQHPLNRRNQSPEPMPRESPDAAVANRSPARVVGQADCQKFPAPCARRITASKPGRSEDQIPRFEWASRPSLDFQEPGPLDRSKYEMGRRRAGPVEAAANLADPHHGNPRTAQGPRPGIGEG